MNNNYNNIFNIRNTFQSSLSIEEEINKLFSSLSVTISTFKFNSQNQHKLLQINEFVKENTKKRKTKLMKQQAEKHLDNINDIKYRNDLIIEQCNFIEEKMKEVVEIVDTMKSTSMKTSEKIDELIKSLNLLFGKSKKNELLKKKEEKQKEMSEDNENNVFNEEEDEDNEKEEEETKPTILKNSTSSSDSSSSEDENEDEDKHMSEDKNETSSNSSSSSSNSSDSSSSEEEHMSEEKENDDDDKNETSSSSNDEENSETNSDSLFDSSSTSSSSSEDEKSTSSHESYFEKEKEENKEINIKNEKNPSNEMIEEKEDIYKNVGFYLKDNKDKNEENSQQIKLKNENNNEINQTQNQTSIFSPYSDFIKLSTPNVKKEHKEDEDLKTTQQNEMNIDEIQSKENFNFIMTETERNYIEQWTHKKITNLLFSTMKDDWSIETSTFDTKIFGKENILIVIEDSNKNLFGCFINSPINSYFTNYSNKNSKRIEDPNSFVFTLRSNGRCLKPTNFPMKYQNRMSAFTLYHKDHKSLFTVGNGYDIVIYKGLNKCNSFCSQFSFDYGNYSNVLTGTSREDGFVPERFEVFQMN